MRQITPLKHFSSFTFYKTQRPHKKIMCVYFLFHWFSSENFIYVLRSLRKGQQTSKELKRNNDIVFLMSLLNGFFY